MRKYLKYPLHIMGWLILYLLPYLFSFPGLPNYKNIFSNPGDYIHALSFAILIVFSYVNFFILIPKFYSKNSFVFYFIIIAICFWLTVFLSQFILPQKFMTAPPGGNAGGSMPFLFGQNYTILLFIVSVFTSITIYTRRQLHRIENEKLQAELLFLKAQINPHFLFNTLNSIYALAINKDDKTPDAIVHLSELMRYIIKDANENVVPLDKELAYINNYIALQRSRLGDTAVIQYTCEGKAIGKKIVPLILISFIENAFKHGVNPNERSEIDISITITNNILSLDVANKKVSTNVNNIDEGVGLKNSKDRLALLYPAKHELIINDSNNNFSVKFSLDLS